MSKVDTYKKLCIVVGRDLEMDTITILLRGRERRGKMVTVRGWTIAFSNIADASTSVLQATGLIVAKLKDGDTT